MDALARGLLEKLLTSGNRSAAGVRSRQPSLTASQLGAYRALPSFQKKRACEDTLLAARSVGAIEIIRDRDNPEDGFIERINLADVGALARFLGEIPLADQVAAADDALSGLTAAYPVVTDILQRWSQTGKVRGLGPRSLADWRDSAAVIDFARSRMEGGAISLPIREASAALFRDSKRIERLAAPVDVLLSGAIDSPPRPQREVWQEIGLFREEQPVLLAGKVVVVRERVTALLDAPYAAFPAATILQLATMPQMVLSIENLTTFHSEAKRRCDDSLLLLYTGGMPSPAWRAMYRRLLRSLPGILPVHHWGDVDEGGFRIASALAAEALNVGHQLRPWSMHPDDVPEDQRRDAADYTIERMQRFARQAGWETLADAIGQARFTVEQESL